MKESESQHEHEEKAMCYMSCSQETIPGWSRLQTPAARSFHSLTQKVPGPHQRMENSVVRFVFAFRRAAVTLFNPLRQFLMGSRG
ncbi:hypothetical protein RRG08_062379 [Elysia crispata]|uniref:Uncharacterized protein n=1 Tax=Elysia crispata TaxID=231223 RepID=A0AAE0YG95_9GAST|nr:hypothetical protein RRG08_062379 [Elysia crispata]